MGSENKFFVIGVGLPRTGTASTRAALEILLPGKCYHMLYAHTTPGHDSFWKRMCQNEVSDEEIKRVFVGGGFVACVDAPTTFFYKKLSKVFPNAKFLLNKRSPASWVSSMKATVCKAEKMFHTQGVISSWMGPFGKLLYGENFHGPLQRLDDYGEMLESCSIGKGEEFFNKWNERLISELPKDKLLVFDVKEGWEPLCKFLNVPVPLESFPHVNDQESFVRMLARFKMFIYLKAFLFWSVPLAAISAGIYFKYSA